MESWIESLWTPLGGAIQMLHPEGTSQPQADASTATRPKRVAVRKETPSVPPRRFQFVPGPSDGEISPLQASCGPSRASATSKVVLKRARWLTSTEAVKQTIELTFELPESFQFRPGDSFGVYCPNRLDVVNEVLQRIGEDEAIQSYTTEDQAAFPSHLEVFPTTIRQLLLWVCDLASVPRKSFLAMLSLYCSDPADAERLLHLSSLKGKDEYRDVVEATRPTLADLFALFPSCKPPTDHLVSCLPPMAPRYYSYASAPSPDRLARVAFSLADIVTASGKVRSGLCTYWLASLATEAGMIEADKHFQPLVELPGAFEGTSVELQAFQQPSSKFHLPEDPALLLAPRILIGPGTGVAPFMGFLAHLAHIPADQRGDTWMFFGCRKIADDYLYQDELEAFVADGLLHLETAFSRETEERVYVQHKMLEHSKKLGDLIVDQNAFIYICG